MDENEHEEESFDIIEYPLKLKDDTIPFFVKLDPLRYEFRILDTVDSKRIHAQKRRKAKELFLHLRINEDQCDIVGSSTSFFEFVNSCDFYLEQTSSTQIYNELTSNVLTGSLNDLISSSMNFKDMIETNTLPEYTPLILNSTLTDSINLNTMPVVLPEHCDYKINYEDNVPTKCSEEYFKRIEQYIQDDFEWLDKFFKQVEEPIIRVSHILKLFKAFRKSNSLNISFDKVKKTLPIYRYFYCDGPWRKSWILYGIDPKIDKSFFKYQIVDLRNDGVFYTLLERETIIKEVEEHQEWYLKDDCDKKYGYFKKTLEQLVIYHNYVEFTNTEEEDMDFDVFDI